jgi:hypothetical protein
VSFAISEQHATFLSTQISDCRVGIGLKIGMLGVHVSAKKIDSHDMGQLKYFITYTNSSKGKNLKKKTTFAR